MQRDFLEPGGFGETLGNDLAPVLAIMPTVAALIGLFRHKGWPILHTRESHAPDLSDCPPAKRDRGAPALRIGDVGPMGRILVRGEPGAAIVRGLRARAGRDRDRQAGQGHVLRDRRRRDPQGARVAQLVFAGVTTEVCVQTSMREANDRGYECLLIEDATASYFPAFKAATLAMIRAQGAIVGWTTPLAALEKAIA